LDEHTGTQDRVADGWRHLRAFFREGAIHLPAAIAAFEDAERAQRRVPGKEFDVLLMGLSLALRLRRTPEDARRAVVLAQELVNRSRRERGEGDTLALRAYLESAYKDLADVERGEASVQAARQGIEAADRTLRLARTLHVPEVIPSARAAKAALLLRLSPAAPPDEAARRRRQAERLYTTALDAWPARDPEGRAAAAIELADLWAASSARRRKAESLVHSAEAALAGTGNRHLIAAACRVRARLALAEGRPDALDVVMRAAGEFRALGWERDALEVEAML